MSLQACFLALNHTVAFTLMYRMDAKRFKVRTKASMLELYIATLPYRQEKNTLFEHFV